VISRNEKWEQKRICKKIAGIQTDYILYDLAQDSLLEPLSLQNKHSGLEIMTQK